MFGIFGGFWDGLPGFGLLGFRALRLEAFEAVGFRVWGVCV